MRFARIIVARLRALWRRDAIADEIREEMESHLAMRAQDYERAGWPPDAARGRAAVRERRRPAGSSLRHPGREDIYKDLTDNFIVAVARLRPGVTVEQARADFLAVASALEQRFPEANARTSASVTPLRGNLSSQARFLLIALGVAAACVLLIVCANLANLLIARALGRRRELAVRTALGAGRERIMRQLGTETLVLAVAGGALGVVVAIAGVPLLGRLVPVDAPIAHPPFVDVRAAVRRRAHPCDKRGVRIPSDRAARSRRRRRRPQRERSRRRRREAAAARALVIAEIAASVVLLVLTGLLLRALLRVQAIDPGFRTSGVLTLQTDLRFHGTIAPRCARHSMSAC